MSVSTDAVEASDDSNPSGFSVREERLLQKAIALLDRRLFQRGPCITSPQKMREYLKLQLAPQAHEVFAVVFLDANHGVIAYEPLFQGTIDNASVYPRVVLRRAMALNAAAVVLAHNHPSGVTVPSEADKRLTERLKTVLGYVDVRVLDHFIVGKGEPYSFAEAGWP